MVAGLNQSIFEGSLPHQNPRNKDQPVLSLEGEPQGAVLELNIISAKDGVDKIIARLNKIYKKDELTQKYNALEQFEKYKRQDNTTIRNSLIEFEKRFHKTRSYGTVMSDELLAYHLIKSANLTT